MKSSKRGGIALHHLQQNLCGLVQLVVEYWDTHNFLVELIYRWVVIDSQYFGIGAWSLSSNLGRTGIYS
jgi:hypothetical protein